MAWLARQVLIVEQQQTLARLCIDKAHAAREARMAVGENAAHVAPRELRVAQPDEVGELRALQSGDLKVHVCSSAASSEAQSRPPAPRAHSDSCCGVDNLRRRPYPRRLA